MTEKTTDKFVVLVTCGALREARKIGRAAVKGRLAACANLLQAPVESIYRWKGKVETGKEFLMMLKTSRARLKELQEMVKRLHSYDVPEIVALRIEEGSREYLAWLSESVRGAKGNSEGQLRKTAGRTI